MAKKLSKLQRVQQKAESVAKRINEKIGELGKPTSELYSALNEMQGVFDRIRNVTEENRLKCEKMKTVRVDWKQKADNIEEEYKKIEGKTAGQGAASVGAGIAFAAFGPTAAMGIATTFGVASTGTAISTLSGAAATNAALAWLGGGALAAGGGGMAAGNAFLALAGPVGWAIAGVALVASGVMLFKTKSDKERLENIFTLISERDIHSYKLAFVEIEGRIGRITNETKMLTKAAAEIETFGTDYNEMSEMQQYKLGAYVNLMEASTSLLVNPILGLQPKYTEEDFEKLCNSEVTVFQDYFTKYKVMIISMANLLYGIELDDKEEKLLAKSLKKNKEFLASIGMSKKEFDERDISMVRRALKYKDSGSLY